ncbi:MAG: hypothetical protein KJO31_03660 [Gammaproteobacteria bacterium]|nr:hypothetical protein [Gammaproteobacteria bacterium]
MTRRKPLHSISLLIFAMSTIVATAAEPSLKEIMQDLRDNLVEITDGLLVDDFERVARGAAGVAQHAPISAPQAKQIAAALGPEMPAFKQFDEQVHALSLAIASAASDQDRDAVIVNYRRMVDGCVACHAAFKERVAAVLSKSP